MNSAGFGVDFVEAFTKTTELYDLTEEEKEFVFRVFCRFRMLTAERREKIMEVLRLYEQDDNKRIKATVEVAVDYAKAMREELLIGIHNYNRQESILNALRGMVVLLLPPAIANYMLGVLSK